MYSLITPSTGNSEYKKNTEGEVHSTKEHCNRDYDRSE